MSRSDRPRVVVAGLGDTGLLTAIHLSRFAEVLGISAKPGLVSGQELGLRLARPEEWARDYWISFDRYRRLDRSQILHGSLTDADLEDRTVTVTLADGAEQVEPYDVLVISTGVTNGFWRSPDLRTREQIDAEIRTAHERLAGAGSVAVIGGGAAAVSAALNLASRWPDQQIDLYFPGDRALPQHHHRVWQKLAGRLREQGVGLHSGHRAQLPSDFTGAELTTGPVTWEGGQPPVAAGAVLWAIGRVRPNTSWLPRTVLDDAGFVRVDEYLRVPGHDHVFAIGDVAATDPVRTSARSRADRLLAANIRASSRGGRLKPFVPATRRWGSVVGAQRNALEVFTPAGQSFRLRPWSVLQPWVVRRGIYRGIRGEDG